jgi:hypothetical protein
LINPADPSALGSRQFRMIVTARDRAKGFDPDGSASSPIVD